MIFRNIYWTMCMPLFWWQTIWLNSQLLVELNFKITIYIYSWIPWNFCLLLLKFGLLLESGLLITIGIWNISPCNPESTMSKTVLGCFPFVRTSLPDHCWASQLANEIGFFQKVFAEKPSPLGFDWSGWTVLIKVKSSLRREWFGRSVLTNGKHGPYLYLTWGHPMVTGPDKCKCKGVV